MYFFKKINEKLGYHDFDGDLLKTLIPQRMENIKIPKYHFLSQQSRVMCAPVLNASAPMLEMVGLCILTS